MSASVDIVEHFLQLGAIGAVAVVAMWVAYKKDREVKDLYERLLSSEGKHSKEQLIQEQEHNKAYSQMLGDMNKSIETLALLVPDDEAEEEHHGQKRIGPGSAD
jgi:hypothetical protein